MNKIITADGTKFRQEGVVKRIIIRTLIGALLLFGTAAVIGLGKAALAPAPAKGNSISDFNDGWNTGLSDILEIGKTAKGRALINSCLVNSPDANAFHTCIDK